MSFYISGGMLLAAAAVSCLADLLHRRNLAIAWKEEGEVMVEAVTKKITDLPLVEEEEA